MATQMLAQAPAVAAAPRQLGALLTAAIPGDSDTDWGKGVISWPEAVPGWRSVADCAPATADYGLGEGADPVGAIPFVVQTLTRCPRISLDLLIERASRQLDAVTSQAVARELWTGDLTRAEPWTLPDGVPFTLANPRPASSGTSVAGPWLNPHLAAADMIAPAEHPAEAVGAVEAAAAERIAGGPVFVHIPVDWLMPLSQFGIYRDGNLLRTPLGSVVVCDAGYPGTTTGGAPVVYATGPVQAWVGDPVVLRDPAEIVELGTNQIGVWAERPALVSFDQQTLVGCAITT